MAGEMSWVGKKIHLYNVTMGLYMLDWWERCLFSILPLRLRPIQFLRHSSLCKFRPCLCWIRVWFWVSLSRQDLGFGYALVRFVLGGKRFVLSARRSVDFGYFFQFVAQGFCYWIVLPLTRVDILVLILLWFICFNGSRFATDVFERYPNKQSITTTFVLNSI
jgi:hypothetical protein